MAAVTVSGVIQCIWAFAAYLIALAIYRLYFSPLAKFPGPKLAGMSFESYPEVIHSQSLQPLHRYTNFITMSSKAVNLFGKSRECTKYMVLSYGSDQMSCT